MKFRQIPLVLALTSALAITLAGCGGGGGGGDGTTPAAVNTVAATSAPCPAQALSWTTSNTTCSGAGTQTASGSIIVVTNTAGDLDLSSAGYSVWWTWTAPTNGQAEIFTSDVAFDTRLGVFTGSAFFNSPSARRSNRAGSTRAATAAMNKVFLLLFVHKKKILSFPYFKPSR